MKILFTVYSPLGYGGAEVSMRLLAEALKKRGHEVIITSTGDYKGFKTYKFRRFRRVPLFFVHNMYLSRFLTKIIKKEGIDVIHAHDRSTIPGAIIASKRSGIRSVVHFRDYWFVCPKSSCLMPNYKECYHCNLRDLVKCSSFLRLPWNLYKYFYLKYVRKVLKKSDIKIVISSVIKERLDSCDIKDSIVIPNPLKVEKIKKHKHKDVIITFLGSLDYHKGIMNILNVIKDIKGISFLIVGRGVLEREIMRFVRENNLTNVGLMGYLPYDEVKKVYAKSDIIVFPSVWQEPFGRIAIEAMSFGKPVIGSNIGGIKNIIVNGKTGFLVDPLNAKKWKEKINLLVKNKKLRLKLGKAGRKRALKEYDVKIIAKKIEGVYNE